MLLSLLACAVTGPACVGLTVSLTRLRHELRKMRQTERACQSAGSERVAVLEEANETLRRKHRALQGRFDELQGEFVALSYSISHDLRAPLRSIDGFSQALAEDHGPQLTGAARDHLRRVRQAAVRMNGRIDALLELGRLVRTPFQPEPVDLSALAGQIASEISSRDPERRVEWQIQPQLSVQGDRAQLTLLLRSLLDNAHKFSRCQRVAHVSLRGQPSSEEAVAVYEVRDDGVGFDPRYAGRLFSAFQRLHAEDEYPGHGIGLAMAQRIVRRHGGTLWATAEPGEGAVFSFTLPEPIPTLEEPAGVLVATGEPVVPLTAVSAGTAAKASAV